MVICLLCGKKFTTSTVFSIHLKKGHSVRSEEYYNKFFNSENVSHTCTCGNSLKFKSIVKGYLKFCSRRCSANSEKTIEKRFVTNKEKYGCEVSMHAPEIRKKIIKKWHRNLGVDNPLASKEVQRNIRQTNLSRYGAFNPMQNKEVIDKVIKTNIKRYGVKCTLSTKGSIGRKKNTWKKNLGVNNPSKNKDVKEKKRQTFLKKWLPNLLKYLTTLNLELVDEYKDVQSPVKVKCLECFLVFEIKAYNFSQGRYGRCPRCYPKRYSISEQEVKDFIKALDFKVIENNRQVIYPLELDIFVFNKNIAVEYNGLYWHSDVTGRSKRYHLDKLDRCSKQNITLIQIFEDEWILHQDIVKARLKQVLGVNDSRKIHARKCVIKEIPSNIKSEFLIKYHLQGTDNSPISIGAFYNDELIAVMTFNHGSLAKGIKNKKVDVWELNRYCCNYNYHIPGIASKLLTYFKKNYKWTTIYSYADRRWSNGNMYYKLGFELDSITKPNYWYIKGVKRIHRFALRKRPGEPKDIPEWLLRAREGYTRVWDCGNLKFKILNSIPMRYRETPPMSVREFLHPRSMLSSITSSTRDWGMSCETHRKS